jgi:hypothetical protein
MGAAPGIQLGIGPESADTLKPPWSALRALRVGCLHLREISQPQVIQYGCTHRTPCHLRALHITNLRVHLRLAGHSNK